MVAFLQQLLPEGSTLPVLLTTFAGPVLAALALVWCAILQLRLASAGAELRRLRRTVRGLEAAESQRAFEYMNRIPADAESAAPRVTDGRRFPVAAE